jgi:hypothetical protein
MGEGEDNLGAVGDVSKEGKEVSKEEVLGTPDEIKTIPTSDLNLDPNRFQYKVENREATGATGSIDKDVPFNKQLAGVVSVWLDPKDGKTYVVNGHNRTAKAKSAGVETMNVMYIDAKSPEEARAIGALQNIADGKGTAVDAAKYFRDTNSTPEDLKGQGISVKKGIGQQGLALSKLAKPLFDLVAQGRMSVERGVLIGGANSESAQKSIYEKIKQIEGSGAIKMKNSTIKEYVDAANVAPKEKVTITDLFGTTEEEQVDIDTRMELLGDIRERLIQDKNVFGVAAKKADILNEAGNQIDAAMNEGISKEAAQTLGVFDLLKNTSPELNKIINNAVKNIKDAKTRAEKTRAKNDAYEAIRTEVPRIIEGGKREGSEGVQKDKADRGQGSSDLTPKTKEEAPALRDVESTAKALQGKSTGLIEASLLDKIAGNAIIGKSAKETIAEEYHKDKAAGKETELTKAVESLLSKEQTLKQEAKVQPVTSKETGITVFPSERANEAESNLVIVQSRKYYTLWLEIPTQNGKGVNYTYLTTLSTNIDEARAKAERYIQNIKDGKKLSVAFDGKNRADIGSRKSIALREEIIPEKDLDKRDISVKTPTSLPMGLDTKLGFGKYGSNTIGEIIEKDINYATWLAENAQKQEIRELIKSHPTFQQVADIKELEQERIKAFEEREKKREEGENVPIVTLVRGEGNKIVEKNEDTAPVVKKVEKKENRVVKDQIKDIIPPNTKAKDNVSEALKPKMFASQIDGANTAIESMNNNGVVLNGDGAGVGKTRQIIAVADHFAKQGKTVVIISENAAIGKPWDKAGANPKLGGSMEKDSNEMGVKINLLDKEVENGKIYISTYNRIKENEIPKGSIVIFDESQNLANTFGRSPDANDKEEKQWETKFKSILGKAQATAFYSATPADKPHQLAYLHKILGFETPEAFLSAAVENGTQIKTRKFGREEIKYYDVPSSSIRRKKLYDWVNGLMVKAGQEGRFIKREISYEGTDVQFHDVKGTNEDVNKYAELFNDVITQMSVAERDGYKLLAPNSYILYAAELAKIGEAVKMAKREKAAGRKIIIFVSRIKEMEIRGKRKQMDGTWSDPVVVGSIPSPVEILRKELEKEGITFVELHGSSKMSSQKAQKEFSEKADALVASLESGGTGINLDDTKGDSPRTEIFMFSPYRGISTIQGMGRIWRASTIQNDNKPNRYVFITTSDIAPDIARSGVLAKKLQLMDAAIGGTAVSKLPMSKVNYDVKQLVGIELPDEGEESAISKEKTGILKPVDIEFRQSSKGNLYAEANADLLEWIERGGVERTGLNIKVFKGDNGNWIALSDKQYAPEEFAPEGINDGVFSAETKAKEDNSNPELVKASEPTPTQKLISDAMGIFYELKDGKKSSTERRILKEKMNEMLSKSPKIKYIFDNIQDINKELGDNIKKRGDC